MIKIISAKEFSNEEISIKTQNVSEIVAAIIDTVKSQGDKAIIKYEKKRRQICGEI